jgi:DNA modification methylase
LNITKFFNGRARLYEGDCIEVMKSLPDNGIDSVVCDPPYHLTSIVKRFGKPGSAEAKIYDNPNSTGAYNRASKGFMGKEWDGGDIAFQPETWAEVMRVMKPGAHLGAFAATRNYHRMACAIEDAGFEIRDMLSWLYGTGFPKNHDQQSNIWKEILNCQLNANAPLVVQISKFHPVELNEVKESIAVASAVILPEGVPVLLMATGKEEDLSEPMVMLLSQSEMENMSLNIELSWEMKSVENLILNNISTTETKIKKITSPIISSLLTLFYTQKFMLNKETLINGWTWPAVIVESLSQEENVYKNAIPILTVAGNATWNPLIKTKGFGTSLKPACEPICFARKPLSEDTIAKNILKWGTGGININDCRIPMEDDESYSQQGRWPANVLTDGSDEVLEHFPITSSGSIKTTSIRKSENKIYGKDSIKAGVPITKKDFKSSKGSAARFFYSSKANKKDRRGSTHPTIKPVQLMQYLTRLVTPKNGIVLDPFAGSGTTGEAAILEGFRPIMIEMENEYCKDIINRINGMSIDTNNEIG